MDSARIEKLDGELRVASEGGLFVGKNEKAAEILNKVKKARDYLSSNNLPGASRQIGEAEILLDVALRQATLCWRLKYIYNVPLFLYYVGILWLLSYIWYLDAKSDTPMTLMYVPIWSIILGGLGSVLRGLWFLTFHVSKKQFRTHWTLAHISAPLIGGILGLLVYLLLLAGFISVSGETIPFVDNRLPMVMAVLAGYNWEWVLDVVDRITGKITRQ